MSSFSHVLSIYSDTLINICHCTAVSRLWLCSLIRVSIIHKTQYPTLCPPPAPASVSLCLSCIHLILVNISFSCLTITVVCVPDCAVLVMCLLLLCWHCHSQTHLADKLNTTPWYWYWWYLEIDTETPVILWRNLILYVLSLLCLLQHLWNERKIFWR